MRKPEVKERNNAPRLCSRCRKAAVDYEIISRRGRRDLVLCRECIRKGL